MNITPVVGSGAAAGWWSGAPVGGCLRPWFVVTSLLGRPSCFSHHLFPLPFSPVLVSNSSLPLRSLSSSILPDSSLGGEHSSERKASRPVPRHLSCLRGRLSSASCPARCYPGPLLTAFPPRPALPRRLWTAFPGPCVPAPRSALRGLCLLALREPCCCCRQPAPVWAPVLCCHQRSVLRSRAGSRSLLSPVCTHSDAALVSACPGQARLCFPGQRGPPPRLPPSVIASFLDSLLHLPGKVDVLCPLSPTPSWWPLVLLPVPTTSILMSVTSHVDFWPGPHSWALCLYFWSSPISAALEVSTAQPTSVSRWSLSSLPLLPQLFYFDLFFVQNGPEFTHFLRSYTWCLGVNPWISPSPPDKESSDK